MNRLLCLLPVVVSLAACGDETKGEVKVVVSKQDDVGRMVIHDGLIYFTKQGSNAVVSARLDSSKVTVEAEGIAAPFDIAASNDAVVVCAEGDAADGLRGLIRIDGAATQLLADRPCRSLAIGGTQVYFSHDNPRGLSRVSIRGGDVIELASLDEEISAMDVTESELVMVMRTGEVQVMDLETEIVRLYSVAQGDLQEVITDGTFAYWVGEQGVMTYIADRDEPLLLAAGSFESSSLAVSLSDATLYAIRIDDDTEDRTLVAIQTRSQGTRDIASLAKGVGSMGIDESALYWSEPSTGRLVYLLLPL